jgi:hypothetical protein
MTKRRKFPNIAAKLAGHVLRGTGTKPTAIFGPIVWTIEPGSDARNWYFTVASVSAKNELRIDQFIAKDDRQLAERVRVALTMELTQRKPMVLHYFDDELEMARCCEAICPGERATSIRAGIERDRARDTSP